MIQRQHHTVVTRDGTSLAVTTWQEEGRAPREVALLLCAIGARQERYASFAEGLARDGWRVVTFDYRGIGRSALPEEARHTASMRAWGEQDLTAVIQWVCEAFDPERLTAVAHSIGGQLLPFADNHQRLGAVVLVASQRGCYRHWRGWKRYGVLLFFRLYIPLCLRLFGRVPLSFVGLDDLERGIAEDYARWGMDERYLWPSGESRSARFFACTFPLLALSFEDDTFYAPRRAVQVLLHDFYTSAPALWCHVEHHRLKLRGLGHSGFFDPQRCPEGWWEEVSTWLRTATANALQLPRREAAGVPALTSIAVHVSRPGAPE
ncbi:alpha/beta fold hydrolase [Hyalangium rubrum]|uniref:Alpha/beta fold hydrolase n=1 Tax=Hyalangium rubrum TaxID=3103134 RepID=A0ABU5H2V8_9BACT|nr:alpha/beta fold hydrolase [Hyalangium sp. s54d21]MDY7227234.1 alpha/beta fold hydrolase [Hyalangium sp. s54d21]